MIATSKRADSSDLPADGVKPAENERPRRRTQLSFGSLLGLALGTLMLVAVGLTSFISSRGAIQNTFELLNDKASLTVATVEQSVRQHLDPVAAQADGLRAMIEAGVLDVRDERVLKIAIRAALTSTPQVAGMAFVSADDMRALRIARDGAEIDQEDWSGRLDIVRRMALAREGDAAAWLPPVWSPGAGQTLLPLLVPVFREGRLLGILLPALYTRELSAFVARYSTPDQTAFILHGRDHVLAHPKFASGDPEGSPERPLPRVDTSGDPALAQIWTGGGEGLPLGGTRSDEEGRAVESRDGKWIFLYRPLTAYGAIPLIIGVLLPDRVVDGQLDRLAWIGLSTLALLLISVALAVFAGRRIARPMLELAAVAERVRRLDFRDMPDVPSSRVREFHAAREALNKIVGALRWFELYLPKRLVHRLLAQGERGMAAAHERDVTVMFTDIHDFSRLSHRLSPSDAAAFLNDHFALVGARIEAEDGTIDKYIGDSVMAFWGAPDDQPDHADRACRAARAIAADLKADNAHRRASGQDEVYIRIGIASGRVLVGNIGAPGRVNYTLVGDVVNLAQRLEQLGKEIDGSGEVVVLLTEESYAELADKAGVSSMGRWALRNRDGRVDIYQLG